VNSVSIQADYRQAITEIKQRIQSTQSRAVLMLNQELLTLYWHIGKAIVQLQQAQTHGDAIVKQMAADLHSEYPGIQGFSRTSLFAMRQFYLFFSDRFETVPQPVGHLPWGHVRTILGKIKDVDIALFYVSACAEHGWTRAILELQIEQSLHLRQGQAISNFQAVLAAPQSHLAQQTLKDPYVFDFLTLGTHALERDIENQLIGSIKKFLLELGKGGADSKTKRNTSCAV
jgi:predicted nuclease of restriction endonuclease-like (RecB) superfamily